MAFPVECRFVRGDYLMLSPATGRNSAYIAIHQLKGMPWEDYFRTAEQIFRQYGGRPHWGKLHSLGRTELSRLYPRFEDFLKLRAEMDPSGRLLNDHLRHLFGIQER